MSRRALLLAATVGLAAAAALGCGRKGAPLPPQWVIPNPPAPVDAEARPDGIRVAWKRPRRYAGGAPLDDLDHFEVSRACPPGAAFLPLGAIAILDRGRFRKEHRFSALDVDAPRGVPCRYRVVAVTEDGDRSPAAESQPVERPAAVGR